MAAVTDRTAENAIIWRSDELYTRKNQGEQQLMFKQPLNYTLAAFIYLIVLVSVIL